MNAGGIMSLAAMANKDVIKPDTPSPWTPS
jgi:hypothetical protein